jgi:hypothetical protein
VTRDPETIQKAIDALDASIELELKKIETMCELRRALMIGKIAPGIFEPGVKVRTRVEGGLTYSAMFGDVPGKDTQFVVSQVDGPLEVKVPLYDVPLELWSEKMVRALRFVRRQTYDRLSQPAQGER